MDVMLNFTLFLIENKVTERKLLIKKEWKRIQDKILDEFKRQDLCDRLLIRGILTGLLMGSLSGKVSGLSEDDYSNDYPSFCICCGPYQYGYNIGYYHSYRLTYDYYFRS